MEHYLQLSFAVVMATTWVPLNSGVLGFPSLNEIRRYGTLLNQYSTHDGELRSVPGVYSNCSMGSGRITKITFISLPGVGGNSTVLHFNREASTNGTRTISLSGATQSFGGGFGYELDLSAPTDREPFNSGDSLWIRHPYHDYSSLRLLHQVGYDERNICWRELDEDADDISCGVDYDSPLLAIETDPPHCIEGSLNATELRSMWENRATSAVPYSSPDREIMLDCTGNISRILVGAYLTGTGSEEGPSIEIDGQYCNLSPDQVTEHLNVYECILESPVAVDNVDSVLIVQRNTSSRIAFLHDGESDTPLISLTISGECGASPFLSEDDVRERTAQFIPNFIQLENDCLLYPHLNITQDGYLTKWTFAAEDLGQGHERPVLNIYRFNDMGIPVLNNTLPGSNTLLTVYPNVFEYTVDPPLSVLAGHFIGLDLPPDTTARLLLSFILNNSPPGESLVNFDVNNGNIDGLPLVTLEIVALLGFIQPTYIINEKNGNSSIAVCVILISGVIAPDITVTYTFEYTLTSATQDFIFDSLSGSLMTGGVSVCHMLTVIDNDVVEPDGMLVMTISNSSLWPANTLSQTMITIINDDVLRVYMDITSSDIDEGDTAELIVFYSGILHQGSTVGVMVTTNSDTAMAGMDYDLIGGDSLSLSNTNQEIVLSVRVYDDDFLEDKVERFSISIALVDDNDVKAFIDTPQEIDVTIQDNEQARISFEHALYTISEGEAYIYSFFVVLENFATTIIQAPVTIVVEAVINMNTSNATLGLDYRPVVLDEITFRGNYYDANVRIGIEHDPLVERNEVIHFSLTPPTISGVDNPDGAILGSNPTTVVIITDDDDITVGFDVNSTDSNGTEGEAVSVCIQSYDGILGPNITLDYLVGAPREMTLLPMVMDTATATSLKSTTLEDGDYVRTQTRVTLNETKTSACVAIKLIDDNIVENNEVFLVQVEQLISSDDLVAALDPEYTEIEIIDNDGILMGFERTEYEFNESAGSLPDSVNIVRENPVNVSSEFDIIVLLQPQSTATDGDDFSVPGGFNVTVTFSGTDDRQPFPLDIMLDYVGEGSETVILLITTPGDLDGVIPGDNRTTTITIIEDVYTIQLEHSFTDLRIFNNTVINQLGDGLGEEESTSSMPLSKRGSPLQQTLYVDCVASQGVQEPMWVTNNPIVGGATTIVPEESEDGYGAHALSDYVARLSFDYFDPDFEGVYKCLLGKTDTFVEIFITTVNPYVVPLSSSSVSAIEDSSVTLEFKIAIDSDGNSWNTENINFRFSGFIDDEYSVPFSVCNSEFPQNYCYTIKSVNRMHDGVYIVSASRHGEDHNETSYIKLNVTRRCPVEANGGIQWPWTLEGTMASRPCSDAGLMFRVGPRASRLCSEQGEWEEADLTSCTLTDAGEPFLLVWFVIEADEYTDDMEQSFVDSMKMLLDMNGVEYSQVTIQSAYIASVAVTFHVDLVEGDQKANISQFNSFLENSESFTSFNDYTVVEVGRGIVHVTVAETCMCSSANLGSSLQLCSAASISPCDCIGTVCTCQTPFVGDGVSCTLDSDSDGYPDQALDSPTCDEDQTLAYCIADVCPKVTNPEQDLLDCEPDAMEVSSGCPYGPDDVWGIQWPNTPGGSINTQPCPGGVDALGAATRDCYENGTWGQPNVLSCQSLRILRVSQEASELLPEADAEIEELTPELIASVSVVSEQLAMATDSDVGLLPLDLNSTNNVVAQVLNVLENSVEDGMDDVVVNEELVEVFNNILNETNQAGWTELQSIGSGSQTLLQNTERYGAYLASTVNNTDDPVMLVRENIIITAEVVDTLNVSDIVFPTSPDQLGNFTAVEMDDTAQITIPAEAISRLNTGNSTSDLAIVHIIFGNIEDFLPANTSLLSNSRAASIVISSQLNQREVPDDIFKNNPITLNFTFTTGLGRVNQYVGVFWNFFDPDDEDMPLPLYKWKACNLPNAAYLSLYRVGSGGWSSEGVQVIRNVTRGNVTTVQCNSTHLTSFAVLVDVSGGLEGVTEEEQLALEVVSYIGCIVSSICLSITVVSYLAMGKKLFSAVHYFVHLNLAISLLLGYVVFMLGIELGTSSKGGCAFVAALLQYLFLSAFCWMMCEGVMLYLMLVVVFSKLSEKWWLFLLLGYCTPFLFVVVGVVSRAEYYGVRGDDDELAFCWLSTEKGTIFAFVVPMIAIILINTVFLGFALVALGHSKKQKIKALDKDKSVKQATTILRATLILLPLLGLTWLFGLLTLSNNATVFAWLFTVFNSLQGAAIFFFHVVRNEKVWNKISLRLSCLKCRTFKSFLKYDVFTSYSGSAGQSSIGAMRALQKKPLDTRDASGQAMSLVVNNSLSFTESEIQPGTDVDKEIIEIIPEEGEGGSRTGSGEVLRNPNTSREDEHRP